MIRATIAALFVLIPGALLAQEESPAPAEAPAPAEPEAGSVDLNQPPAAPQAAAPAPQSNETYTVQKGDTLWDLSQKFLGNPWYWPKVWSYNPQIENPHWIYPGNQVHFYPSAEELPAQVEAPGANEPETVVQVPNEVGDVTMGNINAPDQFGQDDDIVAISAGTKLGYAAPRKSVLRQDGLITQRELDDAGVIHKAWAEKEMLSTYDIVYLRFRNQGQVRAGERYSVFRTTGQIVHPATHEMYGYLTHVVGTLRVVAIDKQMVKAVIEQTLEDIHRGDFVGPLGNFDKQVLTKHNTRQMQGVILTSMVEMPFLGENHIVFVDKGSRDGVEEGNTFNVIRREDPLTKETGPAFPPEDVATLVVVDVKDAASACLVVRSVRELVVGDRAIMFANGARRASAQ